MRNNNYERVYMRYALHNFFLLTYIFYFFSTTLSPLFRSNFKSRAPLHTHLRHMIRIEI